MIDEHDRSKQVTDADLTQIAARIGQVSAPVEPIPLEGFVDLQPLLELPSDASPQIVEQALVSIRESLPPQVDRLTVATLREEIRRRLPELPVRMLDAALASRPKPNPPEDRTARKEEPSGTEVKLREEPPWPEPVDLAHLLDDTVTAIRLYVVLSEDQAIAIALWVGMTYAIDLISIAPILLLTSATMRAGKTTLCIVLHALAVRPVLLSSLTPAVIYRLIEKHKPTLIADEADSWLQDEKSELRGIICAGHTRATANIARCAGDDHEVRLFSAWCARAIAMIGRPAATIRDRSIAIELRRRDSSTEPIARLRVDRIEGELEPLRRRWLRWTLDQRDAIIAADPPVPDSLSDRAADCWRPLLSIADYGGARWSVRGREAAVKLSGGESDDSVSLELLEDLHHLFDDNTADWLESGILTAALTTLADRPWPEFNRGRPLTPHGLARLLRPFGVVPAQKRSGSTVHRGYHRSQFVDAWSRYLRKERYVGTSGSSVSDDLGHSEDSQEK